MIRVHLRAVIGLICVFAVSPLSLHGQEQRKLGSQYIPIDGFATAVLNPIEVLESPNLEYMPREIVDAWCIETVGVPVSKVESARIVVGTPGPSDALFGLVVKFTEKVDIEKFNPALFGGEMKKVDIDGHACIQFADPGVVAHQLADDTLVLASSKYIDSVLRSADGGNDAALQKYAKVVTHNGQLAILIAVEPVRPIVNGLLQSIGPQIPPPFMPFTSIPDHLDAILVRLDVNDLDTGINLVLLAKDEVSANTLEEILRDGLTMGRMMAVAPMEMQLDMQEGAVPQAMKKYVNRMADRMVTQLTPKREGRRLTINYSLNDLMSYDSFMVMGLMAPVVQRAELAMPRSRVTNNLRMLGLAMHNHHSAYRAMPRQGIKSDDGTPLLSWRVKVLPFVEEQALYEEFRLDEPWDSDHNIKLLDRMPAVYRHPRIKTEGGKTVYQVPTGEGLMFNDVHDPTRFRDILDGLSNSVMVVATDAESAVPWTKPADWEVDHDNPFKGLHVDDDGQFKVLKADGAVVDYPVDMGANLFHRLLTIAGMERIDF